MTEGVAVVPGRPVKDQLTAQDVARIAQGMVRLLRENGMERRQPAQDWIGLEEAAGIFGYSVSRFYHVYSGLGLVPSRASKRKLRFSRREVESALRLRQKPPRGRPRRAQINATFSGVNP